MSTQTQSRFLDIDVSEWTGETPDETLAVGAGEYSVAEARAIVQRFAEVTTSLDPDAFAEGFTEDSVTNFNEHSNIIGRQGIRDFMAPRFAHLGAGGDFLCRKTLRSLTGHVFGAIWINHWVDGKSGALMRSKGVEFWTMRDGLIARWDASLFAWKI
ncbi:MAG: nuclear transport factor 2 family protein [Pseudomonadota bacterium]